MTQNKRILILTRNFPPMVGGMERLVYNIYKELRTYFLCSVIAPSGSADFENHKGDIVECPARRVPLFLCMAFLKGCFCAVRQKYNVVLAGSGVTAPVAVLIGRIFKIPVIVYVHGLDLIVDHKIYQKVFVPCILKADVVIANSSNTARLAMEKGVAKESISIINPGADISDGTTGYLSETVEKYNLGDKRLLLSVGRLIPRKGLPEFIEFSLPLIVKDVPDTLFVIVGSCPQNALKREDNELERINRAVRDAGLKKHVLLLGRVEEEELQVLFRASEVFVFPVLDLPGDVEGFGMVAVEAAAQGLPTIAFDNGGVCDAVSSGISGYLVEQGDYAGLAESAIKLLEGDSESVSPEKCRAFAKKFSWSRFGKQLRDVLSDPQLTPSKLNH
jgi:phosphatidylinositol alpha-1,6-mannosyltransferase